MGKGKHTIEDERDTHIETYARKYYRPFVFISRRDYLRGMEVNS